MTAEIDSFEYDFSENKGFTVIFYKKTGEWHIKWQKEVQRTATNDNEWQQRRRVTANDNESFNEWQRVVQRETASDNEWQRMKKSDNDWSLWLIFLILE